MGFVSGIGRAVEAEVRFVGTDVEDGDVETHPCCLRMDANVYNEIERAEELGCRWRGNGELEELRALIWSAEGVVNHSDLVFGLTAITGVVRHTLSWSCKN